MAPCGGHLFQAYSQPMSTVPGGVLLISALPTGLNSFLRERWEIRKKGVGTELYEVSTRIHREKSLETQQARENRRETDYSELEVSKLSKVAHRWKLYLLKVLEEIGQVHIHRLVLRGWHRQEWDSHVSCTGEQMGV